MQKISREQATEIIGFIILYTNYYSMPEWEEGDSFLVVLLLD